MPKGAHVVAISSRANRSSVQSATTALPCSNARALSAERNSKCVSTSPWERDLIAVAAAWTFARPASAGPYSNWRGRLCSSTVSPSIKARLKPGCPASKGRSAQPVPPTPTRVILGDGDAVHDMCPIYGRARSLPRQLVHHVRRWSRTCVKNIRVTGRCDRHAAERRATAMGATPRRNKPHQRTRRGSSGLRSSRSAPWP